MREILFRGKEIKTDKWVYGYFNGLWSNTVDDEIAVMIRNRECEYYVKTETVGQYTGLQDKNGKKIFEGDIVKFYFRYGLNRGKVVSENLVVSWNASYLSYEFTKSKWDACFISSLRNDFEVLGNIHDNPELWEAK